MVSLCLLVCLSFGETFVNPIGLGADPSIIRKDGYYYLCSGGGGNITIRKSVKLQDIVKAPHVLVWSAPATGNYSKNVWAPELNYLDGKWYIYVAADDGDNVNHKSYVLEGTSQDPQDPFVFKGKISAPTDRWAIDASILETGGKRYLIWSGWQGTENVSQNIYIAPMSNPWTISGERVLISTPEFAWEKMGGNPSINEGPEALYHNSDVFIIYSASGSWSDFYCLGQLRLTGKDPMNKASWTKTTVSVFAPTPQVFGPGHCSFTKSPDGSEDWMVYHSAVTSGAGFFRNIRMQKFTWNPDGNPNFGVPVPDGQALEAPSDKPLGLFDSGNAKHLYPTPYDFEWLRGFRDILGRR